MSNLQFASLDRLIYNEQNCTCDVELFAGLSNISSGKKKKN